MKMFVAFRGVTVLSTCRHSRVAKCAVRLSEASEQRAKKNLRQYFLFYLQYKMKNSQPNSLHAPSRMYSNERGVSVPLRRRQLPVSWKTVRNGNTFLPECQTGAGLCNDVDESAIRFVWTNKDAKPMFGVDCMKFKALFGIRHICRVSDVRPKFIGKSLHLFFHSDTLSLRHGRPL